MDVAMMQPAFMPWQGFFELIYKSEIFIFLDDFQFSVQSYHQRNRMFIDKARVGWYVAPVLKSVSFGAPLNQTRINETTPWRKKMVTRLCHNYSKAPYYKELMPDIEKWLMASMGSLAEQNIAYIKLICRILNFKRDFVYSSQFPSKAKRSERVIELLQHYRATRYFSAQGAFEYMAEDGFFPLKDKEVLFQDFKPKPYAQIGCDHEFVPYLSALDALFNLGPEKTGGLIMNGTPAWLSWSEMAGRKAALLEGDGIENQN